MKLMNRRDPNRRAFSRVDFFSPTTSRFFLILRIFILLVGAFLLVLGAVMVFTKTNRGSNYPILLPILSLLGGIAAFWGNDFGQGRVVVTTSGIKTRNRVHQSARKEDIESLDINHSNIGEPESTTPVLHLRNGK